MSLAKELSKKAKVNIDVVKVIGVSAPQKKKKLMLIFSFKTVYGWLKTNTYCNFQLNFHLTSRLLQQLTNSSKLCVHRVDHLCYSETT